MYVTQYTVFIHDHFSVVRAVVMRHSQTKALCTSENVLQNKSEIVYLLKTRANLKTFTRNVHKDLKSSQQRTCKHCIQSEPTQGV